MKATGIVMLWLLGSICAIGVAWTGVSVVGNEVINPPTAGPIDHGHPAQPAATSERLPSANPTSPPPNAAITATSSVRSVATWFGTTPTSGPARLSVGPADLAVDPVSATTPTTTGTATVTSPTTIPAAPATVVVDSQSMTFTMVGGKVSVIYSPGQPLLLWALPSVGYQLQTLAGDPMAQTLTITFDGTADLAGHQSRLDAWWDNGPQYDITETHLADNG